MNKAKLIGAGVLITATIVITTIAVNIETPSVEVATTTTTQESDKSSNLATETDDTKKDTNPEDSHAEPQGISEATAPPAGKTKPSVPKVPSGSHHRQATSAGHTSQKSSQPSNNDASANNINTENTSTAESTELTELAEVVNASEQSEPNDSEELTLNPTESEFESKSESEAAAEAAVEAAVAAATGAAALQLTNTYPWQDNCLTEHDTFYVVAGYPACECTSYVAWKTYEAFGITLTNFGNANFWDAVAQVSGYVVDSTPTKNSIAQVKSQPYGHLYWVEQVNPDGSISVTDYNNTYSTYLVSGEFRTHDFGAMTISASQVSTLKYIHPNQRLW